MMERLKAQFVFVTLMAILFQLLAVRFSTAFAAGEAVIINEVAWAGSSANSNDEWIELYNPSSSAVDLNGWQLVDDGEVAFTIAGGQIGPRGYFLIEDSETAVSGVTADLVAGLSLANTGDSLVLKDADGATIDAVNSGGGAWYAGSNTTKASMERIDPLENGDSASNWASAVDVTGTPRAANSNYAGGGPEVSFKNVGGAISLGSQVTLVAEVNNVTDLYAYGFDVNYDPNVLNFVETEELDFLSDGSLTAFNSGLQNGNEGTVVIGNARLGSSGISGSGELFAITFEIVGESEESLISFGGGSFLADTLADMPAKFTAYKLILGQSGVTAASNLQAAEGSERYSIKLNWESTVAGATYVVKKQQPDGSFVTVSETTEKSWTDKNNIIPNVKYKYQIFVVANGASSVAKEIIGFDSRGLIGDSDRSDRVDGRDIEKLAKAYGSMFGTADYDALVDSNFDGLIDGSDLINIGVNFAMTYSGI